MAIRIKATRLDLVNAIVPTMAKIDYAGIGASVAAAIVGAGRAEEDAGAAYNAAMTVARASQRDSIVALFAPVPPLTEAAFVDMIQPSLLSALIAAGRTEGSAKVTMIHVEKVALAVTHNIALGDSVSLQDVANDVAPALVAAGVWESRQGAAKSADKVKAALNAKVKARAVDAVLELGQRDVAAARAVGLGALSLSGSNAALVGLAASIVAPAKVERARLALEAIIASA